MAKSKPVEPARSRAQAGHTQQQAAELLGVHPRTWQAWEAGINTMLPVLLRAYRHLAGIERMPFKPY